MQPATDRPDTPRQPPAHRDRWLRALAVPATDSLLAIALCALLLACYVATIYVVVLVIGRAVVGNRAALWLHMLALLLTGAGIWPVYSWVWRGVNQLIDGWPDDPYGALTRLNQDRLRGPSAQIIPEVAAMIATMLKLPYVAITSEPGSERVEVGAPPARAERVTIALTYGTIVVGTLEVVGRRSGQPLSAADVRLLHDLARQVGITLHAARLSTALQASRERLVLAREEERRRIRRDLHDGLGPTLGILPLKLDLAVDLTETNPVAARELLLSLKDQIRLATADVRRLVHALRPPTLDELGLLAAIREQAARAGHDGLSITVEALEPLAELPAAVEVAAYRIVQEALTNIARHAGARSCLVSLRHDISVETLCLEVVDDGCGLPVERSAGVGLASMRERAEELGGRCVVEAVAEGGTRVHVVLPLGGTSGDAA